MAELSTKQVHDAFKVDGYKIILPGSWETYGKARIMVFANEEVKVKIHFKGVKVKVKTHFEGVKLKVKPTLDE